MVTTVAYSASFFQNVDIVEYILSFLVPRNVEHTRTRLLVDIYYVTSLFIDLRLVNKNFNMVIMAHLHTRGLFATYFLYFEPVIPFWNTGVSLQIRERIRLVNQLCSTTLCLRQALRLLGTLYQKMLSFKVRLHESENISPYFIRLLLTYHGEVPITTMSLSVRFIYDHYGHGPPYRYYYEPWFLIFLWRSNDDGMFNDIRRVISEGSYQKSYTRRVISE